MDRTFDTKRMLDLYARLGVRPVRDETIRWGEDGRADCACPLGALALDRGAEPRMVGASLDDGERQASTTDTINFLINEAGGNDDDDGLTWPRAWGIMDGVDGSHDALSMATEIDEADDRAYWRREYHAGRRIGVRLRGALGL